MAINAEDGAILRGADIVRDTRSDLTSHIDRLRGDIESISRAGLDGQMATQFRQLMTRWNEDASRLVGALDNFDADLRGTQRSFESTDEDRAARLNIDTQLVNFSYPGA